MLNKTIILIFLLFIVQSVWGNATDRSLKAKCYVEHDGQKLNEGESTSIKGRFYKVENCELHRAYHACGRDIFAILNIVCHAVEKNRMTPTKRHSVRFVKQKLLTEACCQSLCTVSEMTRYCPK